GASALNLGYLTHPRPSGGAPRGEGFELRTDRHGAVRAAGGLLLTTEPRPNESKHHKDLPETAERLATASEQQDSLAELAKQMQAQEPGDQDAVAKDLHKQHMGILGSGPGDLTKNEFAEFTQPHLVVSSPAGIALTTPGPNHLTSGSHLALSSTGHTSLSIGKRLLASASQGMRFFVQSLGWKLVSASGDIDIRALKDSINLLAKLDITANAERIILKAKTELVVQGGGSATTYNASGITHVTSANYTAHAAQFAHIGAASKAGAFPEPPKPGKGALELFNLYANSKGIQAGDYEVTDALGTLLKGTLDGQGFNAVSGAAPGPATAKFGLDTVDTWSLGSFVKGLPWPKLVATEAGTPSMLDSMIDTLTPDGSGAAMAKVKQLASSGMAAAKTGLSLLKTGQAAMQTVQQVQGALQGGVAGLPQLASVANSALPAASSTLGAASRAGAAVQGAMASLAKLPALPERPAFKAPNLNTLTDLMPGELIS
uniref:type VI secretion system Vgr family protein n=1 Tax=Pseudomonas sp. LAM2023 TaxID=2800477 RepID=UPI00190DFE8C